MFMTNETKRVAAVLLLTMAASAASGVKAQKTNAGTLPTVFLLDAQQLQITRQRIQDGDKNLSAARAKLERDAEKAMSEGPFSVVTKGATPPSGDKHDYMSQAPYFWPDPKAPGGLPYLRRDGERNPEIRKIPDHDELGGLISATETLALGYYFLGDETHAAKAASLLRTWFLDPATRM